MYIYHELINALSAHIIHINLNIIFYTHVEHSPTKTSQLMSFLSSVVSGLSLCCLRNVISVKICAYFVLSNQTSFFVLFYFFVCLFVCLFVAVFNTLGLF